MSLRRLRYRGKRKYFVTGYGRNIAHLRLAKRLGAVDSISVDPVNAFSQADVVVLCVPVPDIIPVLRKAAPHLNVGAIVTDVGSVKKSIVEGARRALSKRRDVSFVGAHPIAGSEKAGVRFARPDLFKKATCVITKDNASFRALQTVKEIWQSVGARCVLFDAAGHDHWLAMTSHLPHLLAFSLFSQVNSASKKNPIVSRLVAGSFRDMTRIAGSDPQIWAGIIESNRRELRVAVASFLKQLRFFSSASTPALKEAIAGLAREKSRL